MHVTLPVQEGLNAISDARRAVASQLREWGVISLLDSAELVVSELVTNARLHTAGPIVVALTTTNSGVRIEVTDTEVDALPAARQASVEDANGRGLTIVSALSADWGVNAADSGKGKVVWAELSLGDSE